MRVNGKVPGGTLLISTMRWDSANWVEVSRALGLS